MVTQVIRGNKAPDFSVFGRITPVETTIPRLPELVVAPIVKTRKAKSEQTQPAKPTVKHDKRQPITVWYSARSVTPVRSVAYRTVNILVDFGFAAIGTIEFAGETRFVERTSGAWELSQPIAPYIGSK